jgi:hypothetical protein
VRLKTPPHPHPDVGASYHWKKGERERAKSLKNGVLTITRRQGERERERERETMSERRLLYEQDSQQLRYISHLLPPSSLAFLSVPPSAGILFETLHSGRLRAAATFCPCLPRQTLLIAARPCKQTPPWSQGRTLRSSAAWRIRPIENDGVSLASSKSGMDAI